MKLQIFMIRQFQRRTLIRAINAMKLMFLEKTFLKRGEARL